MIAEQHHDKDHEGCAKVGQIPEPILAVVSDLMDRKQRAGTGFDS